jgi:hypothetical protein
MAFRANGFRAGRSPAVVASPIPLVGMRPALSAWRGVGAASPSFRPEGTRREHHPSDVRSSPCPSRPFLPRLLTLPGSVVADRNRDRVIGDRPRDVHEMTRRLLRMLDGVRERLGRCEQELEDLRLGGASCSSHIRIRSRRRWAYSGRASSLSCRGPDSLPWPGRFLHDWHAGWHAYYVEGRHKGNRPKGKAPFCGAFFDRGAEI